MSKLLQLRLFDEPEVIADINDMPPEAKQLVIDCKGKDDMGIKKLLYLTKYVTAKDIYRYFGSDNMTILIPLIRNYNGE